MPPEYFSGLPVPLPLPSAVQHGVFGWEGNDPISPDSEQVRCLTEEHAHHMLAVLHGVQWLAQCQSRGLDPQTGAMPRGKAVQHRAASIETEIAALTRDYDDLMAVYTDAFGDEATASLDQYLRSQVTATRLEFQQVLFPS